MIPTLILRQFEMVILVQKTLDFKKSFRLWFQIINQNKGKVCIYFLNKIVELLKSEHRSKSIADCWLHIETTCLFDPDWVSKQGCCYCCFAGMQAIVAVLSKANSFRLLQQPKLFAQSGSNSTTSKSRDWEIEIGAVVSLLSSISNTVLPALSQATVFNRVCICNVCLFTLKYTCFSRGFIVNINYVYTALSILLVCSRQQKKL